nr:tetratricopeptide repeat protein [Paracidobacterium acidisoli]
MPAQQASESVPQAPASSESEAATHGRLILVLPFENHSGQASLDWMEEAFPDIFNRRLASAGFLPIIRADRLYAFDHLGLPLNLHPSHATAIRIAQMLDADYIVFGDYTVTGDQLTAETRILDVTALHLGNNIQEQSKLEDLLDTANKLAWEVARQFDPTYAVAEQTFLAADGHLPVSAFENYIRGVVEDQPDEGIRHLRESIRIDPNFPPAWLALGRRYFANQDYDEAAATFGHLPTDYTYALEADFYRGLAFFYTGNYMKAEDAFAFVSTRLPLPEVVNNQGVAASRRGKDAAALFREAIAADPKEPDYHFNLAVSLAHSGKTPEAVAELQQTLKLRPQDAEAQSYLNTLQNPGAVKPNPDPGHAITDTEGPLERIRRTYNEAGFRQAAFEMEQVQKMRLASMPPAQRAAALVKDGDQFFQRGLVLEAEHEYQSALSADPSSAAAHAGLAAVRERSGDQAAARDEAQKSLHLAPNADAHLVLARLDLAGNQLLAAAGEVSDALKVDPASPAARGMKQALEARGQQVP